MVEGVTQQKIEAALHFEKLADMEELVAPKRRDTVVIGKLRQKAMDLRAGKDVYIPPLPKNPVAPGVMAPSQSAEGLRTTIESLEKKLNEVGKDRDGLRAALKKVAAQRNKLQEELTASEQRDVSPNPPRSSGRPKANKGS